MLLELQSREFDIVISASTTLCFLNMRVIKSAKYYISN